MPRKSLPVIIGVGQCVSQWNGRPPGKAPSPLSMAADASRVALADAGLAGQACNIDTLAFIRVIADSYKRAPQPHGANTNLPGTLAREIGASPHEAIYSAIGGNEPQAMVNEMAARIHAGEAEMVLIAGAEANRASKAAQKHGIELDWADGDEAPFEDRGFGGALLCRREIKHGLIIPAYMYALFETAQAAAAGHGRAEHRAAMAAIFARFSEVAATNPYAQFPEIRDAAFLATVSKQNYEIADPFLKWHIAQDAVNQSAAILMVSEEKADDLGVPVEKRIYLHGSGEACDTFISEREDMGRSDAMDIALNRALDMAGKTSAEIDLFDLYSCFPCAVTAATDVLDIDPHCDKRALTVTGGLPFFGGPGNNYSLHAIASMTEGLRAAPDDFGLVLANGGWLTKQAIGIYSACRPDEFRSVEPAATLRTNIVIDPEPSGGVIETYMVAHGRGGPSGAIAFGRTESGARCIANAAPEAFTRLRENASQIGAGIIMETVAEVSTFRFS